MGGTTSIEQPPARIKGLTRAGRAQQERLLLDEWEKAWSLIHQPQQKRAWTNALVDFDRLITLLPESVAETLRDRLPRQSKLERDSLSVYTHPSTILCFVAMTLLRYNAQVEDAVAGVVASTTSTALSSSAYEKLVRTALADRRDVLLFNYTRDVLIKTLAASAAFETEVLSRLDAYDASLHTHEHFWLQSDQKTIAAKWTVDESVVNFRLRQLNDAYVWDLLVRVLEDGRVREEMNLVSRDPASSSAPLLGGSCLRYSDDIPKCLSESDRCQIQTVGNHLPTCTMNPAYIDKVMGCMQQFITSRSHDDGGDEAKVRIVRNVLRDANFCEILEAFLVQSVGVGDQQAMSQRLAMFRAHVTTGGGDIDLCDDKRWVEDATIRNPLVMTVYVLYRVNRMVVTPNHHERLIDHCLMAPQSWKEFDHSVDVFFAKTKRDAFVYSAIALASMNAVFDFVITQARTPEFLRSAWPTSYHERKQVEQAAVHARGQQQRQFLQQRFENRVPYLRKLWKMLRTHDADSTARIAVGTIPVLDHLVAMTSVADAPKDARDKLSLLQTACGRDDDVARVRHPGMTALMFLTSALEFVPAEQWSKFTQRRGAAVEDAAKLYQFFVQPTFRITVRLIEQWWAKLVTRGIVRARKLGDAEVYDPDVLELAVHAVVQLIERAPPQTWRCRPYAVVVTSGGAVDQEQQHQLHDLSNECPAYSFSEQMCVQQPDNRCSFDRSPTGTRASCQFNPVWLDRCIQAIRMFTTRGDDAEGTLHHKLRRLNAWGVLLQMVAGDTFADPDFRDRMFRQLQEVAPNTLSASSDGRGGWHDNKDWLHLAPSRPNACVLLLIVLYRVHCANQHGFDKRFIAEHEFIKPLASAITRALQRPGAGAYVTFFGILDRLLPQKVPFTFDRDKLQLLSYSCELLLEAVSKQMRA